MENDELSRHFAASGRRHGYDDVDAAFAPFRDFKIRWCRSYRWASFEVSDYLKEAPGPVMATLAETVFDRIAGDEPEYPGSVCEWLTDPAFARRNQPLYVSRYVGLSVSPAGRHKDLRDSMDRLVTLGLVTDDRDVYLGWSMPSASRSAAGSSVLMKVATVSGRLDSEDVPEQLLDYCLYSQIAHIGMGFNPGTEPRGEEYDRRLSMFPGRRDMETELRRMGLHI